MSNENRISAPPLAASASDVEAIEPVARVATFWNGEPCEAVMVRVVVADDDRFTHYWAREYVGEEREAVRVTYADFPPFYIDNENGDGWAKVTAGKGSPRYGHSSLAVEREIATRADHAQPTTSDAISEAAINNNPSISGDGDGDV